MQVIDQSTHPPEPSRDDLGASLRPRPHGPPPPCPLSQCRAAHAWPVPGEEECRALWDRFAMPEHIRLHSLMVALIAEFLAQKAEDANLPVDVPTVRASALLHDLAKDYTIRHGGNHSQLGGAWTVEVTGNPAVALGVTHHVYWPWDMDPVDHFLPLTIIYADKRVKHGQIVTLDERHADLVARYGVSEFVRQRIEISRQQVMHIEQTFSRILSVDLHACTFDSRGLVQRT